MLSKGTVAVNKIILILFFKERCTEGVKNSNCEPVLPFRRRKYTLFRLYILSSFPQILICSYGIKGKIWEPSSGENNVSGFHNVAILL